ncbi:tyrosine-type recombinase/integrase [Noviherbaspirillum sp.]|uniref:tyrosine-type recombinase/integrase n=1 Tax=Noviherbaspirillum sp. TaxID=1926288 RepID=UPI002B466301|nr:integrase arm-type DNA-binding domain-containing protein [Noviherbaspirillum sp.]HJV81346.1 integrase arm-type DNA-binding domain-containing protein [Noviherbaspirillum sp.]
MPLTDTACKNTKPDAKPRKLSDGGGMFLLIHPNGSKYWRLAYRFAGKQKLLALGVYPEITLADARARRDQARKLLAAGIDPSEAKRKEKRIDALNRENTFEAVAREWHDNKKLSLTPSYAENVLHRLEADIFPLLGTRPISEIEAPDLLDALRQVEKRGALEIAKRLGQTCGQVFRYAIATGRAKRNPVPDLKDALKPSVQGHYAALEAKDLPEFLRVLDQNHARLYTLTRLAIRLMMLTFVRTQELIGARWSEFNLEESLWIIPAARMKMRKEHIVPLSSQAMTVLRELEKVSGGRELVFPNQAHPDKPMSNNTILFALGRLGYKGKMTGHGFRALAMSTIKEKLGYRHEVIDRQLAHGHKSKVDKAYDRATFLDERKKMMQEWADYLDAISTGKIILGSFGKAA